MPRNAWTAPSSRPDTTPLSSLTSGNRVVGGAGVLPAGDRLAPASSATMIELIAPNICACIVNPVIVGERLKTCSKLCKPCSYRRRRAHSSLTQFGVAYHEDILP